MKVSRRPRDGQGARAVGVSMGRGDLTGAEWEPLRPLLPVSNQRCDRWRDHRQVTDGILHRVRTGAELRDLPELFGPGKTIYERHLLWSADGTWERLLQQVQAAADGAVESDWDISVDSTVVRAHRHAAGARTDPPPMPASKGPQRRNTRTEHRGRAWSPAWRKWCCRRGSGPVTGRAHQLAPPERGRSLPPAVSDRHRRPASRLHPVHARPGQDPRAVARTGQAPQEAGQPRCGQGLQQRPVREDLRRGGIRHTIPEKTDGLTARLRRGPLQEAQHRRTGDQLAEAATGRRHSLRPVRQRLPRHRHRGSPHHLDTNSIGRTGPSGSRRGGPASRC